MEALPFMENFVNNRPENFPSIEKGIEYMFRSEQIKIYKVQEFCSSFIRRN